MWRDLRTSPDPSFIRHTRGVLLPARTHLLYLGWWYGVGTPGRPYLCRSQGTCLFPVGASMSSDLAPFVPPSQSRSTSAQLRGAESGSARIQVDATGDMSWSEETATSFLTENSDKFLGQTTPSSVASTWTQVRPWGRVFLCFRLFSSVEQPAQLYSCPGTSRLLLNQMPALCAVSSLNPSHPTLPGRKRWGAAQLGADVLLHAGQGRASLHVRGRG